MHQLKLYFPLKYFYDQLNDFLNAIFISTPFSLIDNLNLVLSFENTDCYPNLTLATFLLTQRYKY